MNDIDIDIEGKDQEKIRGTSDFIRGNYFKRCCYIFGL